MSEQALATKPVAPIGQHLAVSFHHDVWIPTYPPESVLLGGLLRELRIARSIGLRDAANRLGMSAVMLSQLERGVREFVDQEAAMARVRRCYG